MFSRISYLLSLLLLCYASFFFYPKWQQHATEATISWDVSGYYWYLPALFIYDDVKHISFKDSILQKYQPTNSELQQAMQVDNGNYVMKYSSGMAIMYLPFFTVAHVLAAPLGYSQDGFSLPYQFAIQFGGLLISLLGLWYLRNLLLLFYSDKVTAITLFLLTCGTNYLNYAAIDSGMSHTWLFTIYVFLMLNTHYFYKTFKMKYAVRIGLLIGLATLTRPTEIISCFIPLLWGMEGFGFDYFKRQFGVILQHFNKLLIAAIAAAIVTGIQLVYWKYVSGHWLVYSYGDQGFYWSRPNVLLYSFNYRCGWLTYCPMMLLAIAGIIPFLKSGKNVVAILIFISLNYYIVSAWEIWWYGGRAMVQSYAVFAFPLAALIHYSLGRRRVFIIVSALSCVFVYFNVWIVAQYHGGGLYDGQTMSKAYFWRVVGRWHAPESTKSLLDVPEMHEANPKDMRLIFEHNFDTSVGFQYVPSEGGEGKGMLLNKSYVASPYFSMPYLRGKHSWIRVQSTFRCWGKEWNIWNMPKMIVRVMDKDVVVKVSALRVSRFLGDGETKDIYLDVKLPEKNFSSLTFVFRNELSDKEILVDNIKIWEFN